MNTVKKPDFLTSAGNAVNFSYSHIPSSNLLLSLNNALVNDNKNWLDIRNLIHNIAISRDIYTIKKTFILMFSLEDQKSFCTLFYLLYSFYPGTCILLLPLIPKYKSWEHLVCILILSVNGCYSTVKHSCINLFVQQITNDFQILSRFLITRELDVYKCDKISSCARFIPKISGKFSNLDKSTFDILVNRIVSSNVCVVNSSDNEDQYRKIISILNNHIDMIENKRFLTGSLLIIEENYGRVEYEIKFNRKISGFHDFIKIVKSNREPFFPHEIIEALKISNDCFVYCGNDRFISGSCERNLINKWNNMRDQLSHLNKINSSSIYDYFNSSVIKTLGKPVLPMCNISRGMMSTNNDIIPMFVSISVGVLLSELNFGLFADKLFVLEQTPSLIDLSDCLSVVHKVVKLLKHNEYQMEQNFTPNSNLIRAFETILETAIANKMNSDELPYLLILTNNDIQPDFNFKLIDSMFEIYSLVRPSIVFWNINSSTKSQTFNTDNRIIMLNGFSSSLLKYIVSGKELNSPDLLFNLMLHDEMYDQVNLVLSEFDRLFG